jgi:hypothetical protein
LLQKVKDLSAGAPLRIDGKEVVLVENQLVSSRK